MLLSTIKWLEFSQSIQNLLKNESKKETFPLLSEREEAFHHLDRATSRGKEPWEATQKVGRRKRSRRVNKGNSIRYPGISGHIMFHWSLHDFKVELWRGMWIFLLLLKIILSCHTQIYGKKNLCMNSAFKKNDDTSVGNYLLSSQSPPPQTAMLWLWQQASLRSPLKLKAVWRVSSDQWNVTSNLLGEVSGYHFPHKKQT